jgi:hypothetical protein
MAELESEVTVPSPEYVEKVGFGCGLSARYCFRLLSTLVAVEVSPELTALCNELSKSEKVLVLLVLELSPLDEVEVLVAVESALESDVPVEFESEESDEFDVWRMISETMLSAVVVSPDCKALLSELSADCSGLVELLVVVELLSLMELLELASAGSGG